MEIRRVDKSQINPAPYNPRKDLQPEDVEYQKLARSIEAFGDVEPLVWNERTGNLVGGHQRFKILLDQGREEFDVSVVDLDDTAEKQLNLALNKISGEWDNDKLSQLLSELADVADIALTGFDASELEQLCGAAQAFDFDAFFEPAEPKESSNAPKTIEAVCPECGHRFVMEL